MFNDFYLDFPPCSCYIDCRFSIFRHLTEDEKTSIKLFPSTVYKSMIIIQKVALFSFANIFEI
jgi:hypothetical protein